MSKDTQQAATSLLRYLEAINGLLRRDSVSETDRDTDKRFAMDVARELEAKIAGLANPSSKHIVLTLKEIDAGNVTAAQALAAMEGKTFQINVLPGDKIRLYSVEITTEGQRCPAVVGGERCAGDAGHAGKHYWSSGD